MSERHLGMSSELLTMVGRAKDVLSGKAVVFERGELVLPLDAVHMRLIVIEANQSAERPVREARRWECPSGRTPAPRSHHTT